MTLMASFCILSNFSRLGLIQGCETQTIVNDAVYHPVVQPEQMALFDAFAATWRTDLSCPSVLLIRPAYCMSTFCRSGFPRYLRLFVRSLTSPLTKTVGIACRTVLLLRVHHRACSLLGLISDSVSWHQSDTFSSCS